MMIVREYDKTPFFLIVQMPPNDMKMLMSRETYEKATHVEIPARINGYAWVKDGSSERVFTAPGTYTIYTSEILESESGGYTCAINYKP